MRVLYLHGFASSPHGRKVDRLRAMLEPEGFEIFAPDLNAPSFRWLDFEAMVVRAGEVMQSHPPDVVVGSSLGSLVALSVSPRQPDTPLVLIAPAFSIADRWRSKIPDGDPITVFNYAVDGEADIHRRFFDQMSGVTVDENPPPSRVTIFMGRLDESIPFDFVAGRWAEWKASGRLVERSELVEIPDGDHGLVEFSDRIADAIREAVK